MKVLKFVGIGTLSILMIVGGLFLWASTATDTSLAARGIMWGTASAGDWEKYTSRSLRASSQPHLFEAATPGWLDELKVDQTPLGTWLEANNTTAFIILHGDELLYEGYFNGSKRESTQSSLSVAKSFASTLVGIAIDEGYIGNVDDPITAYLPELVGRDERFASITIRHLLTMSSGIRFTRDDPGRLFSDDFISYASPDLRRAALDTQIAEAPGLRFHYNDYNPLLIGMVLERATGMSVSSYLETRLWQPMGAEGDGSWDLDSDHSGFEKMSVGVNGRAIDMAKLGWLFINQGRNGERQVVPAAWVDEATRVDSTSDPAAGYQYFWWVDAERNAFYAEGNFCQFIYVYPAADLVLVRLGTDCGAAGCGPRFLGDVAKWVEERLGE